MNKRLSINQLAGKIAESTGKTETEIRQLLEETIRLITDNLSSDGEVNVKGLGIFRLKWTEARTGRNPQTGEEIEIPAQNRVVFKPEAPLRRFVNREFEHLKPQVIEEESKDDIDPASMISEATPVPAVKGIAEVVPSEEQTEEPVEKLAESKIEPEPKPEPEPYVEVEQEPEASLLQSDTIAEKTESDEKKSRSWLWILLAILLMIILLFIFWPSSEQEIPAPKETGEQAEITPAPEPVTEPEKTKSVEKPKPIPQEKSKGTPGGTHAVQAGDNLWGLAESFYGDVYLWPNIYNSNQDKISNPDALTSNISLEVPGLEGTVGKWTNNDKKDIAEGYARVYFVYDKMGKSDSHYYMWVTSQLNKNVFQKYTSKMESEDVEKIETMEGRILIK